MQGLAELTAEGFTVVGAEHGLGMPRLRGIETLVAIHDLAPDTKVIMMSDWADPDEAKRALAVGVFDYVAKPFDLPYLDRAITAAVLAVE